eukprot:scaffold204404_cov23-Tisochrysis_lutea.AAC.1
MLYYTHTILFGMGRRKENYVGSDNIPHISEGKEDPKGRGTVHLLHQERKKNSMGIGGFTSSTPCLILVTRFERGFLKSASRKFIGVLNRINLKYGALRSFHCLCSVAFAMKLQSKLDDFEFQGQAI